MYTVYMLPTSVYRWLLYVGEWVQLYFSSGCELVYSQRIIYRLVSSVSVFIGNQLEITILPLDGN